MSLTITVTLPTLPGGAVNNGWCVLTLVGVASNLSSDFLSRNGRNQAANNGVVSIDLLGNDVISTAGTSYQVDLCNADGSVIGSWQYTFTGSGNFALSSLTPMRALGNGMPSNPAAIPAPGQTSSVPLS
jgi:hypothetical protein